MITSADLGKEQISLRVRKNITSRFRPDRFPKTCQVLMELNFLQALNPLLS